MLQDSQIQEIVEKLEKGGIKLHEIENFTMNDSNEAARVRRIFLEKKFGVDLRNTASHTIDFDDAISRNIENPIGATQIPLGYAGDLKVNGDFAKGQYPILLATTEGRLVAGISRGIGTFNRAGGVNTSVIKDGITRDVLIRTANVKSSSKVLEWIRSEKGFDFLKSEFSKTTKHGKLIEVRPYTIGRDVHIRFKATTGAAMGMNMVTIAAKYAVDQMIPHIEKELGINIIVISESGNLCSDKKPAYINVIEGRGVSVIADAVLPADLLKERFRVEPEMIVELNRVKNLQGSALAGSHGFNAHVANILAAMYMAYGQDVAQIVEGSQAVTDAAIVDGNLYVSCFLPAIEVGTYGGGTKRETQKEALTLSGIYGDKDFEGGTRLAFAEMIAAACLVGDVNLLAIQAAGELSKSHGQIKRG